MSFFDSYFNKVFCINLDRSADRWAHVEEQRQKFGLVSLERVRGYDFQDYAKLPKGLRDPMENAMCGCTASHAAILHTIGLNGWDKVLVLEDDFAIVHDNFHSIFEELIQFVPEDWDMLYLGAHYANPPAARVNEHVIKADRIFTTSSYAIRGPYARFLAPMFFGSSAPDMLFSGFNKMNRVYVLQPRLMVQYPNTSVIWGKHTDNGQCMLDARHEAMV